MDFKTVMIRAAADEPKAMMKLRANRNKHPVAWKVLENFVIHRYKRKTGKVIGGEGFDWETVLEWIKLMMPIILKLIMLLFV